MMNKWLKEGLTYQEFLNTDTEEIREKALKRWDTMIISTEVKEAIEKIEERVVIAFMELGCPDSMVVLPYLEKMKEINPKIQYRIMLRKGNEQALDALVGHEGGKVPTLVIYQQSGEQTALMEEYPERFKKRLKGLDKEDTQELITRYRRGYYNNEIIEGILKLLNQ